MKNVHHWGPERGDFDLNITSDALWERAPAPGESALKECAIAPSLPQTFPDFHSISIQGTPGN